MGRPKQPVTLAELLTEIIEQVPSTGLETPLTVVIGNTRYNLYESSLDERTNEFVMFIGPYPHNILQYEQADYSSPVNNTRENS